MLNWATSGNLWFSFNVMFTKFRKLGNLLRIRYFMRCVFFEERHEKYVQGRKKKLLSGLITRGERVKSLNISLWYGRLIHFYGFLFFLLEMLLPVFGTGFGRLFYMACGISLLICCSTEIIFWFIWMCFLVARGWRGTDDFFLKLASPVLLCPICLI